MKLISSAGDITIGVAAEGVTPRGGVADVVAAVVFVTVLGFWLTEITTITMTISNKNPNRGSLRIFYNSLPFEKVVGLSAKPDRLAFWAKLANRLLYHERLEIRQIRYKRRAEFVRLGSLLISLFCGTDSTTIGVPAEPIIRFRLTENIRGG